MNAIEIVPGQSIGGIRLGAPVEDVPEHAVWSGPSGELAGVRFVVMDGKVDDVWIDDLRKVASGVRVHGRIIAPDASLDEIKNALGPCHQVVGVKGGVFFNCDVGVTIGSDFLEKGEFVQLRLKPR